MNDDQKWPVYEFSYRCETHGVIHGHEAACRDILRGPFRAPLRCPHCNAFLVLDSKQKENQGE